jgi:hypothetical protein
MRGFYLGLARRLASAQAITLRAFSPPEIANSSRVVATETAPHPFSKISWQHSLRLDVVHTPGKFITLKKEIKGG